MYTGDAYIFPLAENTGRAKEGRVAMDQEFPPNTTTMLPDDQYHNLMRIEAARFDNEFRLSKLRLELAGIGSAIVGSALVAAHEIVLSTAQEIAPDAEVSPDVLNGLEGAIAANGIALAVGSIVLAGSYGMRATWRNARLRKAAARMDRHLLSHDNR